MVSVGFPPPLPIEFALHHDPNQTPGSRVAEWMPSTQAWKPRND